MLTTIKKRKKRWNNVGSYSWVFTVMIPSFLPDRR